MSARFCTSCGAQLVAGARFCVECGSGVGASAPVKRTDVAAGLPRYAPLVVSLAVVVLAGIAITLGVLNPKQAPPAPRPDGPVAPEGSMPAGHPPVQIPEQVRQTIRDMSAQAAAAPDDLAKWKQLAEVQYRAAQIDPSFLGEAETSYRHVLEIAPNDLDAIRALGNVAYDRQDAGKAIEYYGEYLKQKPEDLEVKTDLGTMHLAAGRPDDAIGIYETVLRANPKLFQAQFNLAIAFRAKGDQSLTLAALEKARDLAPDEPTKSQVEQLLARLKGEPPPTATKPSATGTGSGFQADVEAIFKQNPVLGPKVQRVEWNDATSAKVFVREFPMDQMPPEMRSMFMDRMKGRLRDKKNTHQVTATSRFEMVDESSGRVMDTITE